jgi:hypothetical protein
MPVIPKISEEQKYVKGSSHRMAFALKTEECPFKLVYLQRSSGLLQEISPGLCFRWHKTRGILIPP